MSNRDHDLSGVPEAALSIRLPWAWWVASGAKPIENRSWRVGKRVIGRRVFIHAGVWWSAREIAAIVEEFAPIARAAGVETPTLDHLMSLRGRLIGAARIVDCVEASDSPWFFGPHGIVMSDPVLFKTPVRCVGALSFFRVDDSVRADAASAFPERGAP